MKTIFTLLAILYSIPIFAQGEKVAKDLEMFITAPKTSESESMTINGQTVDLENAVIFKAFEEHKEWKDVLIVADWTGSMYPYLGQVMRWHELNKDKGLLKHITMFNDGDDIKHPNRKKIIGKTGGIYHANPNNLKEFLDQVKIAVDNGDGGDGIENDVEAIIEGIEKAPNCKTIVLVADETGMRDFELISKINKPVHVILVNTGYGEVKQYLKLAHMTKGSITTPDESYDFSNLDPNIKVITFGGQYVKIKDI